MKTDALWTGSEAAVITGGTSTARWRANGLSIDSRSIAPADLFVALTGPNHDGHGFVADAFERGASAALVDHRPDGISPDQALLIVDDVMAALQALAAAGRIRIKGKTIAITGSVGKTGTKAALEWVLGRQAPTIATRRSLNNHIGVPVSLARVQRGTKFGVFEVGMNHAGEIAPLSRLIAPDIAIITNIAPAHTAFFDSIEDIADAKAEIFEGLRPHGTAILNRDIPYFDRLAKAAKAAGVENIVSFGEDPDADIRLIDATLAAESSEVVADVNGTTHSYHLGLAGRHWIQNSLAILAAVRVVGADLGAAMAAMANIPALTGRGRRERVPLANGALTLIDESYNANPASMVAAIETMAQTTPDAGGRRICVLGEMRELGVEAEELHTELAQPLSDNGIDLVVTVGGIWDSLNARLPEPMRAGNYPDTKTAADAIKDVMQPGDVIMVKGSQAGGMALIVEAIRAATSSPSDGSAGTDGPDGNHNPQAAPSLAAGGA